MSSMIRRFVHLIVDDLKSSYTLRRIDTSPLFAAGVGKDLSNMHTVRLPRPVVCFDAPNKNKQTEFFLLGSKIVSINNTNRRTLLYDTLTNTMCAGPHLRQGKGLRPAWAALQGKLYLANAVAHDYNKPCFEALGFDYYNKPAWPVPLRDWSWELLPSPPFAHDPFETCTMITSFAVAGDGKNIWVSTKDEGTFTFDITTAAWRKEGDWTMPFAGQLQYIPDYNLCFGFCRGSNNLCSVLDLVAGASEPPVHLDVWEDVDDYNGAKGWNLARSYLTYLGSGRFCVTRFYDTRRSECVVPLCDVAVMTGVELKHSSRAGELQVTKGSSRCYKFASGQTLSGWVL